MPAYPIKLTDKFLQILRCAIGSEQCFPDVKPQEWPVIYGMTQQQSLMGVIFEAIKSRQIEETHIPFELLMEWMAVAEQISGANEKLNKDTADVSTLYEKQGFMTCILKGQGI